MIITISSQKKFHIKKFRKLCSRNLQNNKTELKFDYPFKLFFISRASIGFHIAPVADITAFEQAMRQAGADWQMVFFGGAVHSFTNPTAGDNKASGAAYDARAARRSWRYMQEFFQEIWRVQGQD